MAIPAPVVIGGASSAIRLVMDLIAAGEKDKADALIRELGIGSIEDVQSPEIQDLLLQGKDYEVDAPSGLDEAGSRQAQLAALTRLQSIADQDGFDPQSVALMNQARADAAQQTQGAADAVRSQMARRGMVGSGADAAMSAQASQVAANSLRQGGLDAAAQARQRALQAISASGSLAGQMRGGDRGAAEAELARRQFNANIRKAADMSNVESRFGLNSAQLARAQALNSAANQYATQRKDTLSKNREAAGSAVDRGSMLAGDLDAWGRKNDLDALGRKG